MLINHSDSSNIGTDYELIRFKPELELERILEEDFALSQYYDIFDNKDELEAITNEMLSNGLLLNRVIAPRIFDLCDKVKTKLGFSDQIDFYLISNTEANAFSLNGFGLVPHVISITSSLIQQASDDELQWIIGHEIGHLIYSHNKLDVARRFIMKGENERPPAGMTIHYLRYGIYGEISADRIGYMASPNIDTVIRSLFKISYGISESHFNLDIGEYLKQLDRIKEINVGNLYSSHPNSMIRVKALLEFARSDLFVSGNSNLGSEPDLDTSILADLQLLEVHPKSDRDKNIVDFLSAAGMYVACCEEESLSQKWETLYDWLADYTSEPEKYLQFDSIDDVIYRTKQICMRYSKETSDDIFPLLERIVVVTLIDGRLEPEEKKRLFEISSMMNVSQDAMNLTIKKVSETYLAPNRKTEVMKLR